MWRVILLSILMLVLVGVALRLWMFFAGIRVTSWWRSPWHNATVGGNLWSLHQFGLAVDVVPVNPAVLSQLRRIPLAGLIVTESDHLHVQVV